jgi:toxin ParE1/3/4
MHGYGQSEGAGVIVCWLLEASDQRYDQLDFIAQENPIAAIRLDEEIEAQTESLAQNPEIGRNGRVDGTLELVIARTPFLAVYRVESGQVQITNLLHQSQQWP